MFAGAPVASADSEALRPCRWSGLLAEGGFTAATGSPGRRALRMSGRVVWRSRAECRFPTLREIPE